MEKGRVTAFDLNRGFGSIARQDNRDVQFYANSILGKDRLTLKAGDFVFYELENIRRQHTAINIRKCM